MLSFSRVRLPILTVFITLSAALIPNLPEVPTQATPSISALPTTTPQPSPSLTPAVSPTPTASAFSVPPLPDDQPDDPSFAAEVSSVPTAPSDAISIALASPQPDSSEVTPASPSATPSASQSETVLPASIPISQACTRDISDPRPTLGINPSRYAFSVFASASAIAVATLFYRLAADWETTQHRIALRIGAIVFARICIIFSIKVSSTLVAISTNEPGNDSGADAGGVYLTWATAILTSVYYEAVLMTLTAVGLRVKQDPWYPKLCRYLSPCFQHDLDAGREVEDDLGSDMDHVVQARSFHHYQRRIFSVGLWKRISGGTYDRHLLMLSAVLYVSMELTTLFISMAHLLESLSGNVEEPVFVESTDAGQCQIIASDAPVLFGVIVLQTVFLLTKQQSLVPLLALVSESRQRRRQGLRWGPEIQLFSSCAILMVWLMSLIFLPLLRAPTEPMFIVGDISLFWYVVIAPPSYDSLSFIVTLILSVAIVGIGLFLLFRISKLRFGSSLPTVQYLNE